MSSIFRSSGSFTGSIPFLLYLPYCELQLRSVRGYIKKKKLELAITNRIIDWYFIFVGGASVFHKSLKVDWTMWHARKILFTAMDTQRFGYTTFR